MAILINKPTSVSANSSTVLELNKAELQAKLEALNASDYWKDQNTWKAVSLTFKNSNNQKLTVVFDASGNTTNLSLGEFFLDGDIECQRIFISGFANDRFIINRNDFDSPTEFDIGVTGGYTGEPNEVPTSGVLTFQQFLSSLKGNNTALNNSLRGGSQINIVPGTLTVNSNFPMDISWTTTNLGGSLLMTYTIKYDVMAQIESAVDFAYGDFYLELPEGYTHAWPGGFGLEYGYISVGKFGAIANPQSAPGVYQMQGQISSHVGGVNKIYFEFNDMNQNVYNFWGQSSGVPFMAQDMNNNYRFAGGMNLTFNVLVNKI